MNAPPSTGKRRPAAMRATGLSDQTSKLLVEKCTPFTLQLTPYVPLSPLSPGSRSPRLIFPLSLPSGPEPFVSLRIDSAKIRSVLTHGFAFGLGETMTV
jgi:hypothetical protein